MQVFSSVDVHNYLQGLDIQHEIFKLSGKSSSLERAAAALGVEMSALALVSVYRLDGEPAIVIIPADRKVDLHKLRDAAGGELVEPVSRDEVQALTGYMAGCLPPVAHLAPLPTFIDYYTLKEDVIYTGSGEPTAILKIRSYDLVRATDGETVDIALQAVDGE